MRLTGIISPDRPLLVVAAREETTHLDGDLPVLLTGMGKVNAAMAVARFLATERPSEIINLGTAGALKPGLHGTHVISRVIQHDLDSTTLHALTGMMVGAPITLAGEGLALATGDVFVSSEQVRLELAEHAECHGDGEQSFKTERIGDAYGEVHFEARRGLQQVAIQQVF
jgi:adenosylhomocysteine nucleosidase